jgi:hypothetical protein
MAKVRTNNAGADVPPQILPIPFEGGGNEDLSAVEKLALAKGCSSKSFLTDEVQDSVGSGNHAVDFIVRVQGGIKKGEPQEQMVVMEIPWMAMAYHLAQEVSPTALQRAIGRALDEDASRVKNFKSECENIVTDLKGKTKREIRGKVTTALIFTKV